MRDGFLTRELGPVVWQEIFDAPLLGGGGRSSKGGCFFTDICTLFRMDVKAMGNYMPRRFLAVFEVTGQVRGIIRR